jgi:hypothetical protein
MSHDDWLLFLDPYNETDGTERRGGFQVFLLLSFVRRVLLCKRDTGYFCLSVNECFPWQRKKLFFAAASGPLVMVMWGCNELIKLHSHTKDRL